MPSQKSLTIQLSVFCLAIITIMATLVIYYAQQAQTTSADQPFVPTKTLLILNFQTYFLFFGDAQNFANGSDA
jgi:hypothetical protein